MQQGLIYRTDQVKKFNLNELNEEDMEEITGQQEIWDIHKEWAEKHFLLIKPKKSPSSKK